MVWNTASRSLYYFRHTSSLSHNLLLAALCSGLYQVFETSPYFFYLWPVFLHRPKFLLWTTFFRCTMHPLTSNFSSSKVYFSLCFLQILLVVSFFDPYPRIIRRDCLKSRYQFCSWSDFVDREAWDVEFWLKTTPWIQDISDVCY